MLAEAAGFVETGEIFVAGLIKRLLRKAGELCLAKTPSGENALESRTW
jgi:hypothetical protein